MKLKNAVILITGSAARVGAKTAILLAKSGAKLIIHYNSSEKAAKKTVEKISQIGHKPLLVKGDLTKEKTWLNIRKSILKKYGRLDVLVNNAAIFYPTPFLKSTEADWDAFMNANLKSTYFGCRIFGKIMVNQKSGKIINIADISTERVWQSYIPYCVSKAGVVALTRGLAKALAPHVTVNAIAPGAILLPPDFPEAQTELLLKKIPLKKFGSPLDIAKTIRFLIAEGDYINGMLINVDGGQSLS